MASSKNKTKKTSEKINHRRPKELKEVDREEEEHNSNPSAKNTQKLWWCGIGGWKNGRELYFKLLHIGHVWTLILIRCDSFRFTSTSQFEPANHDVVGKMTLSKGGKPCETNKDNLFPAYCAFKEWVMCG